MVKKGSHDFAAGNPDKPYKRTARSGATTVARIDRIIPIAPNRPLGDGASRARNGLASRGKRDRPA